MASATVIRPIGHPLGVEVAVGIHDGDVTLGLRLGEHGEIGLNLTVEAAELVSLALQGAIMRAMIGDYEEDDDHG